MLFIYAEAVFTAVRSKHLIDTEFVQGMYLQKWYLNQSITVSGLHCVRASACVCCAFLIANIPWGKMYETCVNRITLIYTLIQVFPTCVTLCLIVRLLHDYTYQAMRIFFKSTPCPRGPFHFHCYPNHCISHGILQSMDRQKYFPCWILRMFFFPSFSLASKHDGNRNRKRRVIPAVPHSVHREKLITWRQAFLGRQRGLGVFHCAHS